MVVKRSLTVRPETWPIAGTFTIARGSKTEAQIVVAEIREGGEIGRGECVPYARYGESVGSVTDAIQSLRGGIEAGLNRVALQSRMCAGAARNALDCALVDLECKLQGVSAPALLGLAPTKPVRTAYTISLGTPEAMAKAAAQARGFNLLKLKLGGANDADRVAAVREAAPEADLIVDANESWTDALLVPLTAACLRAGVKLIEQPLPEGKDEGLRGFMSPVPLCADESCRDRTSLAGLAGKYQVLNLKLDKAGGLTECLELAKAAHAEDFSLMLGCMVATSLAVAPILLLSGMAEFIDLDGPALLARDRDHGVRYENGMIIPPGRDLWG
jgi:L-alanine-DL-glutamate epimerase-like enolase superfamily enzyme